MGYKKAFVVDTSEIEGRLDPIYNLYIKRYINNINTPIQKFKNLLLGKAQYGANETATEYNHGDIRYIRITDITEYGLLKTNSKKTCKTIEKKYKLEYEDLLFARSGATVGKCYLHQENINSIFAGYLIRFKINKNLIYPKYIFYYTQLPAYSNWINAIQRVTAQPNINSEEYNNIPIPLPPKETQNKIIQIMDNAYKIKKENESKAKELLASIDTYLLDKLDITLPKEEKIVSFKVDSSEIFGSRYDPNYYKTYYQRLESSLNDSKYKILKLNKLINKVKTGTTPNNKLKPYTDNGIVFLRNTNLKSFDINLENIKYIKNSFENNLTYSYKNEVIICIAGTIGVSAVNNYGKLSINQNVSSLVLKDNYINENYLVCYLNSKISLKLLIRNCSMATILYLNNDNLKSLKIPLPPLPIQNEIASHIQSLRDEAKHLKKEAKDILKSAKDEVEVIILKGDVK